MITDPIINQIFSNKDNRSPSFTSQMDDVATLRNKLNDWLLDEGLTVSKKEDETF